MKPAQLITKQEAWSGDGGGEWDEPWVLELQAFLAQCHRERKNRIQAETRSQFAKTQRLPGASRRRP